MAKGYWIARVDVHNMDGYKEYVAQNGAVFAKFGAKFLVRGGKHETKEGSSRSRNVVLEFKDYETALACYNSPEYARLVEIRSPHAESDLVIIEGYDGPQPVASGKRWPLIRHAPTASRECAPDDRLRHPCRIASSLRLMGVRARARRWQTGSVAGTACPGYTARARF